MNAAKHRAPGPALTADWTRWHRHRDPAAGPAAGDGWEENQRRWVAAMKVRETEIRTRQMARFN